MAKLSTIPRSLLGAAVLVAAFGAPGCAAVFRDAKADVAVASSPSGANISVKGRRAGVTPATVEVPRAGTTDVLLEAPGHDDHRGTVRKSLNGAWVTIDVITCVIPVALCIPLLVDAVTGAWTDVDPTYDVTLRPSTGAPTPAGAPAPSGVPSAPPPGTPEPVVPPGAGPEISL